MKTFREFILECYELEESSTGERSRGRATLGRGRGADMTSNERSIASIAKKARLRGTGKYSTKDLRTPSRLYTNTSIWRIKQRYSKTMKTRPNEL